MKKIAGFDQIVLEEEPYKYRARIFEFFAILSTVLNKRKIKSNSYELLFVLKYSINREFCDCRLCDV